MSRLRKSILIAAASGHLGCVLMGALQVKLDELGSLGATVRRYGALSGATSSYGFYAPEVGSLTAAVFTIVDKDGRTRLDSLEEGLTREGDIRIANMVQLIAPERCDAAARRETVARWVVVMFERYPDAVTIVADVGHYHFPPMEDFESGSSEVWQPLLRLRLTKRSR